MSTVDWSIRKMFVMQLPMAPMATMFTAVVAKAHSQIGRSGNC